PAFVPFLCKYDNKRGRIDLTSRLKRSAKALRFAEPLKRKVQWTLHAKSAERLLIAARNSAL
ncbi:hypothetical protein QP200_25120, partial [Escherichia coli]|nr:hypothetical protein [Escherichia coli]